MIKIQPARSRIVKTETPEELVLVSPPGNSDVGCFMILIGGPWAVGAFALTFHPEFKSFSHPIVTAVLMLPGIVFLLSGLTVWRRSWALKRTGTEVSLERRGFWGTSVRRWPAEDVSSFFVEEVQAPRDAPRFVLRIGFRNGRSEDVLMHTEGEEVRWLAAVLKEPKGIRKVLPTARVAAEPPVRKVDPAVVPPTMTVRRFETGVEMTFLPLLHFRRRWWKLLGIAILGFALILGVSSLLLAAWGKGYPSWIPRVAAVVWLLTILNQFMNWMQRTVILAIDGVVTIVQNHARGNYQFPMEEVEFVQTFRSSGETELQFLLRGKPKVRLVEKRSPDELEWAARFLRVAIKGRAPEEAAVMKIQTAEGQCQVCGEKMESRVVFCGKCRTPHHEECWSYVGQCSTFACREIRFTRT